MKTDESEMSIMHEFQQGIFFFVISPVRSLGFV